MALVRFDSLSLAFGHRPLIADASFAIDAGERVALVGRNGEGKSSLLGVIAGSLQPDDGAVWRRPGLRIGFLAQAVDVPPGRTVFDIVADGLADEGQLLRDWHDAALAMAAEPGAGHERRLAETQATLEATGGWALEQRVETILSKLSLDGDAAMDTLSGGWRRRVLLARALVGDPDLLLLDEPTNHLDIAAIEWLETMLGDFAGALLFVSHDRAFTRRLATRIVELDRGRLTSWDCDYDRYLERKQAALDNEAREAAKFDKKLADEEAWIRQGIKARRTRNEGRVRALEALRRERRARIERRGNVRAALESAESSGRVVFEAENVSLTLGDTPIVRNLDLTVMRGERIGLVGPNGIGKTSLIRLLLGDIQPDSGTVRVGTRLETLYFDQQREQLDIDRSVMDNVADGSQHVSVGGRRRHVAGYLRDFLFPPERLASPVSSLSGGERNRLLLARLFTRPANLLVLDEPTNDLDIETLELLESMVTGFDGTLLIVSHDRAFLDNTVTSLLVFEGDGVVREYVGSYTDWAGRRLADAAAPTRTSRDAKTATRSDNRERRVTGDSPSRPAKSTTPRKLGFNERRELDALPAQIESLETEQAALQKTINAPEFFSAPHDETRVALERLATVESELETCYARWAELDTLDG